jgi:hypothetical protein
VATSVGDLPTVVRCRGEEFTGEASTEDLPRYGEGQRVQVNEFIANTLRGKNQILFHLLDNAAKFTRRGRIELDIALEEGQLLCSVTDSGIGIAPTTRSRSSTSSNGSTRHRTAAPRLAWPDARTRADRGSAPPFRARSAKARLQLLSARVQPARVRLPETNGATL